MRRARNSKIIVQGEKLSSEGIQSVRTGLPLLLKKHFCGPLWTGWAYVWHKKQCGVHPALKRMVYMALWTFFGCSLVTIFITKGSRDYVTLSDYRVLLWEGFRMGGLKNVSFSNKGSSHCVKTIFVWRARHAVQGIHVKFCNVSSLRGNLALTGYSFYCAILTIPLVYLAAGLKILNSVVPLCFGEVSSRFGSWMVCWSKCTYLHYKYQKESHCKLGFSLACRVVTEVLCTGAESVRLAAVIPVIQHLSFTVQTLKAITVL